MKNVNLKNKISKLVILVIVMCTVNLYSFAQGVLPRLSFKNAALVSGNAGSDKAVYRFSNVTSGVDALVKINGRSSSDVVLNDIDISNTGYDSAFQPLIDYTNGTNIKSNVSTDWYMEFQISFVTSGTNKPTTVAAFNATILDDDGNTGFHEYVSFYGLNSYTLETPTAISVSSILSGNTVVGKRFDGSTTEANGIDVTNTQNMATTSYLNINTFTVRAGGSAVGPINIANNGRQYSLWFKSFSYSSGVISTLPVTLTSFSAQLNNTNDKVNLNWVTTTEIDASHFTVQRSFDGTDYDDAAVVFAEEGNTNLKRVYNYADNISSVKSDLIYYRLKMVDMDGKFTYSEVEVIRVVKDEQANKVITFPNPAQSEIHVTIPENWQNKTVAFNIYNVNGSLVKAKINSNAGQTETLNVSNLPVGTYILRTMSGTDNATQKFIKVN